MMPKDELSVLKIDFVKLRMALNCSSVQKYSLLQLFSNIRRIKKSLIKEINEVFDINYDNIDKIDTLSNYDFLISLYDFLTQIGTDDYHSLSNIVPTVRTYDRKTIQVYYSDFFTYYINISPSRFVTIRSNMFDIEEDFQFCNEIILTFGNKVLFMNIIRSIHDFLIEYLDQICPSNMEIIKLYNENKPGSKHLFRK